jgi:hypothetical protein
VSLIAPVSGFQNMLLMSGDPCIIRAVATLNEMERVEHAFECFKAELNTMNLQFPQHSLYSEVVSMVETVIGPITDDKIQKDFAQNLRSTVESVMPWKKFLDYSVLEQ